MSGDLAWYAQRFDATYLEVYAHRDAAEAEKATTALLAPLGLRARRVLDLACGSGRYLRALQAHGARVVGLDLSAPLLRAAQQAGCGDALGLVRGDMQYLPFRVASFDFVVSMFTSFGYFATAAEDRRMLEEVGRVLRPGGDFVLDFLNAERLRHGILPVTRRHSGRFEVVEKRYIDTSHDLVVKEIELRAGDEVYRYREQVRLWSPPDLVTALEQAGLEVRARWGDYDGSEFRPVDSPRLIVHARRRERA